MKVDLVLWYAQCFLMVLPYFEGAESKSGWCHFVIIEGFEIFTILGVKRGKIGLKGVKSQKYQNLNKWYIKLLALPYWINKYIVYNVSDHISPHYTPKWGKNGVSGVKFQKHSNINK